MRHKSRLVLKDGLFLGYYYIFIMSFIILLLVLVIIIVYNDFLTVIYSNNRGEKFQKYSFCNEEQNISHWKLSNFKFCIIL